MSFFGTLRLAVSATFRRDGDRLLSPRQQLLALGLIAIPGLSLAAEGCGMFVVLSLATGHSGPLNLGAMFGVPHAEGWLAAEVPVGVAVALLVARTVIQPIDTYLSTRLCQGVAEHARRRLLGLAVALPAAYAGSVPSGELTGILIEHGSRSGRAIQLVITSIRSIFGILVATLLLFARDPGLVAAAIATALPAFGAYAFIAVRTSSDTKRVAASYQRASATATEGLRSLAAIKAVGGERDLRRAFDGAAREIFTSELRIARNQLRLGFISLVVPFIAAIGAVLFAVYVRGATDVAALTAMLLPTAAVGARIASSVSTTVESIYGTSVMATSLVPVAEVTAKLRAHIPVAHDNGEEREAVESEDCVVLRDVGYRLPNDVWLFRHIEGRIACGEPLILRGKSGTGKSTLASLISGANSPTEGSVWHIHEGRERVPVPERLNYLSQDPAVVMGTVRANLLVGVDSEVDDDTTDARLISVLRAVELWDELEAKGGLDADIYEGGRNLSGGQIRRLGLARLLLRKRPVWIFDEAVASLDTASAAIVERLIASVAAGAATIVITHDPRFTLAGGRELMLTHATKMPDAGTMAGGGPEPDTALAASTRS